jgi:hypothetical protein
MVVTLHKAGLTARRERDLISEMLLLHIDGAGDAQWAAIFEGQRIAIPRLISDFRKTENCLRLIVDNAVAHHTTMPLRYFADSTPDRKSRDRALVDMLWMNYLADAQDLNGVFADALYMAMPAGFCPVHRYWRDDASGDYEDVPDGTATPHPGSIDCWVGNPFDTVFDVGAKRGSAYACSYGRVLPAAMVRKHFANVPEAAGLEGSTRMPSASVFQRIARQWKMDGLGVHGSPVLNQRAGQDGSEELLLLLCRETLPGVLTDYPNGRLQIVGVPGTVDLLRGQTGSGHVVPLADQALPAKDFSFSLFYSHHRADDILGKPWVEDCDQQQVDLNIALSKKWEFLNRAMESPIVAPGGAIHEDMGDLGGYNIMEIEPSLASWRPRAIEWPAYILQGLEREADEKRRAIFTGGGYQASSRGEAPGSRMAYRAIVALQQADNTVHGPVNQRFRRSACDFAVGCWRQMKTYGNVPWLIRIVGDEYGHLVDPYIDNTKLSDQPPSFKLVNAFGPSPELRAQEVLELCQTMGADKQPFLSTEEARRAYPNPMIFGDESYPKAVQKRRAKAITNAILHLTAQFREQNNFHETSIAHPWVQRAALLVFGQVETQYPRLRDDDLKAHLDALSELTQDETADAIARLAAQKRQDLMYQWQAMQAAQAMPQQGAPAGPQGPPQQTSIAPAAVAAQMQGAGGGPGAVMTG